MTRSSAHLVHSGVFLPFMQAVRDRGTDPNAILADLGVPPKMVEADDGFVPVNAWYGYLEVASLVLNDPYFGFDVGYGIDWGSFPTFRNIDQANDSLGTTLWKLMEETERYATYAKWSLVVERERAQFSIQRGFKPKRPPGQMDAYGLGFFLRLLQSATGSAFSFRQYGAKVSVPEAIPPVIARKIQLARGSNVRASHSFPSRWTFSIWAAPASKKSRQGLDQSLDAIREGLRQQLMQGSATISDLAQLFDTSDRSLQRQLETLGTSFRDELQRARLDVAKGMLKKPEASVDEIAHRLGFGQASSFTRAFRSWTGETPTSYRSTRN